MRRFVIERIEDKTGNSGTGIIIEGIEYSNKKCALMWLIEITSIFIYDNIENVEKTYCGHSKAVIRFLD